MSSVNRERFMWLEKIEIYLWFTKELFIYSEKYNKALITSIKCETFKKCGEQMTQYERCLRCIKVLFYVEVERQQ